MPSDPVSEAPGLVTPVTEVLRREGVEFRVLPHSRPALTCEDAARERGVPLGEMVKCLVMRDRSTGRAVLACLPGDDRLSMAKLKKASGSRAFDPATDEDIAAATGFIRGAIPPLALTGPILAVADPSLRLRTRLNISSGVPTAGIELAGEDFFRVFRGVVAEITDDRGPSPRGGE